MPHLVPRYKGSSGSIFSRAINSLISIETDNSEDGYMNSEERSALDSAKFSIEKCGVERVVHDSKFLVRRNSLKRMCFVKPEPDVPLSNKFFDGLKKLVAIKLCLVCTGCRFFGGTCQSYCLVW